jgi:hypothetical protein
MTLAESKTSNPPEQTMTTKNEPEMEVDEYGNKFWFLNGKFHREDGPAVERVNGTKAWYLHGVEQPKPNE